MALDGSDLRQITDTGSAWAGRWSPDGFLFMWESLGRLHSMIYFALNGNYGLPFPSGVQVGSSFDYFLEAEYSPDSSLIAATLTEGFWYTSGQIVLMDWTGETSVALTPRGSSDASPTWSPDGSRIAFDRMVGLGMNIWVMNSDGSGVRQLTFNDFLSFQPDWSP